MNIAELPYYLEDTNRLEEVELSAIQKLVDQYPYMQQLRFLAAKKAHRTNDDLRDETSEFAAMYTAHPEGLYERLVFQEKTLEEKEEQHITIEEEIQENKNLTTAAIGAAALSGALATVESLDHSETDHSTKDSDQRPSAEKLDEKSDLPVAFEEKQDIYESLGPEDTQEEALKVQETVDIIVNEDEVLQQSLEAEDLSGFSKWLLKKRHLLFEDEPLHKPKIQQIKKHKRALVHKEDPTPVVPEKTPKIRDKSDQINEQIASESLAELYVSQGYKKRAIGMYEKLRLIIPEKSAYFAAQIQKLKEN